MDRLDSWFVNLDNGVGGGSFQAPVTKLTNFGPCSLGVCTHTVDSQYVLYEYLKLWVISCF